MHTTSNCVLLLTEIVESENDTCLVRGGVLDLVYELSVCCREVHVSSTV